MGYGGVRGVVMEVIVMLEGRYGMSLNRLCLLVL